MTGEQPELTINSVSVDLQPGPTERSTVQLVMTSRSPNPFGTPRRDSLSLERTGTAAIYGIPSITTSDLVGRCVQAEPDPGHPRRLWNYIPAEQTGYFSSPMNTRFLVQRRHQILPYGTSPRRACATLTSKGDRWLPPLNPRRPRSTAFECALHAGNWESGCKTVQCLWRSRLAKAGQCVISAATAVRSQSSDQPELSVQNVQTFLRLHAPRG